MTVLDILKQASSISDMADIIGCKASTISFILYVKPKSDNYTQFSIPKKSGGTRNISAPSGDLKYLQRRLSIILQDCIEDINEKTGRQNRFSHGFRRNYSIITNAAVHRKRKYIFNIDLQDFFASINFGRVRGYFIKNENFLLHTDVATVIAQIACHENKLPQGSPTSPVLSNLIGHILDMELSRLAKKAGCTYTRYADDLSFSTNLKLFPQNIAICEKFESSKWNCSEELVKAINRQGFSVNGKKTHMQYAQSSQRVTGLCVNQIVNVPANYYRLTRAMCHHLFKNGWCTKDTILSSDESSTEFHNEYLSVPQLEGRLNHIYQVEKYNRVKASSKNVGLTSKQKLYSNFIFYKEFYSPEKIKIIFEGKTDKIYVETALKSLGVLYPNLAKRTISGKIECYLSYFKYTEKTAELCNLAGGTDQIKYFIRYYRKKSRRFKRPTYQNATIIVLDSDKGSKGIFSMIGNFLKIPNCDGSAPFYQIHENLYVVAIPKIDGQDTEIEDLFEKTVLDTKVNGKTFNSNPKLDPSSEYGKSVFAVKVVKKFGTSINYDGFRPLLDKIDAAVVNSIAVKSAP